MTTMRDCTNPEHALAYDRMRAVEQSWLHAWREATGQPNGIAEYGELLTWITDLNTTLVTRIGELEASAAEVKVAVATATNDPARAVAETVASACQRLDDVCASPEPAMHTCAYIAARHTATPKTC